MQWVSTKRVKLDRTACAWLILRQIDPQAEFVFVTKDEMPGAIAAGAHPFHNYVYTGTPRALSGLQELMAEHGLDKSDPALVLFAESVRNGERAGWAKNGCENEGLWALANGNSALAKDDADMTARMLPIYDALYAYCLQRAAGGSGWTADA